MVRAVERCVRLDVDVVVLIDENVTQATVEAIAQDRMEDVLMRNNDDILANVVGARMVEEVVVSSSPEGA